MQISSRFTIALHILTAIETFKDEYQNLSRLNIEWNAVTSSERVMVYFYGMDKYFTPEIKQRIVKKLLGGIDKCVNEERFKEGAVSGWRGPYGKAHGGGDREGKSGMACKMEASET